MKRLRQYVYLGPLSMNPCFLTRNARDEAARTWACAGCLKPKWGVKAVDVRLQDRRPRDKPLNFVYGEGVPLVHRELLELIDADIVSRDLYIGRVFGKGGRVVDDWVTARGRRRVVLRGIDDAGFRTCDNCGRMLYGAQGKRFLFPAPPADATIYGTHLAGFVIPLEICARLRAKRWRRLHFEKLPILDPPPDGLGVLPEI